jgi:hypothetical protein
MISGIRTTIGQGFRTLRIFFESDKAGVPSEWPTLTSSRALRLCVRHAKAPSTRSGKECYWYLAAALPRRVICGPKSVTLALAAFLVSGCGGLSELKPPQVNADEAASAAIEAYDSDGNGALSEAELAKLPALTLKSSDKDGDSQVSAEEIAARIRVWSEGETGLMSFYCMVTFDGRPLEGAEVTLDPEPFLDGAVKPASGITRSDGAILKIDPALLPEEDRYLRGVQPGLYKVRITHPTQKIPPRYNTATTLGQEIVPGTTGGTYTLTSR